jgi:NRPS condensation-like uncharacterized protein
MYKIKLSPYAKIFYTEWLLNPTSSRYNIAIEQTLFGNLDVPRLKLALKRYVSDHVVLNSHLDLIREEPYWTANHQVYELEYITTPLNQEELFEYVNRSFDLYHGPLYRFMLLRISDKAYRFIVVMHHSVMDGSSSLDGGVFATIANYYNDEHYTLPLFPREATGATNGFNSET